MGRTFETSKERNAHQEAATVVRRTLARRARVLTLVLLSLAPFSTRSDEPAPTRFREGGYSALIERVTDSETDEYTKILAEFDEHLGRHPDDAIAAVERCRFIGSFAYAEDVIISSASDDLDDCQESLDALDAAPVVKLYLLEQTWGEERIDQGEKLLEAARKWEPKRFAALHVLLSEAYSQSDALESGRHALIAVEMDPSSGRQLAAAEYLVRIGANGRVPAMLEQLPRDGWSTWTLGSAVKTLLEIDEPEAARQLIEAHSDIQLRGATAVAAARAMFEAGEPESARALLESARDTAGDDPTLSFQRDYFEVQLDHGSRQDATAAYESLRAAGYLADPFARYRLSLLRKDWSAAWAWQDALGIGAFIVLLAMMVLLPALLIVPIHYRSVVKQLAGHAVAPASSSHPWGLGHLWYAMAALFVIGCLVTYVFCYDALDVALTQGFRPYVTDPLIDDRALAHRLVWYSLFSAIALLPLWLRDPRSIILGTEPVGRSILIGIGAGLTFLALNAIIRTAMAAPAPALTFGTETVRSLQGLARVYGPWTAATVVMVLVPLIEELVFRGVFLRAVSRHLALWVAVLLQALCFMLAHEDVGSYPAVFAIGLIAAWLAWKRSGLIAPMAFHGVVNGSALIAVLSFASRP